MGLSVSQHQIDFSLSYTSRSEIVSHVKSPQPFSVLPHDIYPQTATVCIGMGAIASGCQHPALHQEEFNS